MRKNLFSRCVLAALVLAVASLACSIPVGNGLPTEEISPSNVLAVPTHTATALPTLTPDTWTAKIVLPTVNVRSEPNGAVVGNVRAGASVEILECTKNWCKIKEPAGWVFRGCLSDNPSNLGCQTK